MTEFIGESLHMIRFETGCIPYDIIVSGCDSTLSHTLRYKEEIIGLGSGYGRVHHSTGIGVTQIITSNFSKKS